MFNKVLIWTWVLLWSILVIENMVVWITWYLFLDQWANNWVVIMVSILIWIGIWFWSKWLIDKNNDVSDNDDNFNF